MNTRLCEKPRWDAGSWSLCEYAGFDRCTLYDKKLDRTEDGWRKCCSECMHPFYFIHEIGVVHEKD